MRQVGINPLLQFRCPAYARVELGLEPGLFDFRRGVIAVHGGKFLPLLRQNPVALQIPIEAKGADNVIRYTDLLNHPFGL
jgi:hypothetical protein